jgi:cytochrome c oxidase subunit 4
MPEAEIPVRSYVVVYIALIALVAATTGLAFVNLAPWSVAIALGIAALKALLVILYFMHVKISSRLTRVFVVVGFYWLALLFGGSLGDLLTRSWSSPFLGQTP